MIKVGQYGHLPGTMLVRKGIGKIKGDRAMIVTLCEKPCERNRMVLLESPVKGFFPGIHCVEAAVLFRRNAWRGPRFFPGSQAEARWFTGKR